MKLSIDVKKKIVAEIISRRSNFESQAQMANMLGIAPAQLTRVLKGEYDRVLSDDNFLQIANELGIDLRGYEWKTAITPAFKLVTDQLRACQSESMAAMLIDNAGVGKSHAAKEYVKANPNAVYIDCSQAKSMQLLIREMAKKFGLSSTGKYHQVWKDLVYYLNTSATPLIVLDEAGDLAYPAFLELKALWNATEGLCGWYMMGADGLRAKIDRNINNQKVGYTELFRRFGERYQQITPVGKEELEEFKRKQIMLVAQANGMNNYRELYALTGGSLTRLKIEFLKLKRKEKAA